MTMVLGVDVAVYEPHIDWRALRAQGVRFAFIRATSGIGYVDPKFASHWADSRAEGILRGAYHYLIADQDPNRQADLFLKIVGPNDKGELPPVVDLEDKYNENASPKQIITACKAVLDRLEQAFGRKPIIYSRRTYILEHVSLQGQAPSWAINYPLWLAQYPYVFDSSTMPNVNMPGQPAGWQPWKFWQYSESALVEGVKDDLGRPTECDLDWFRGTEDELYAFANVKKKEPMEYIVQAGDTFKSIAEKNSISLEELLNANPSLPAVGSKLVVPVPTVPKPIDTGSAGDTGGPVSGGGGAAPIATRTHTVKKGETLGGIALKYGTTVDAIMAINPQITNRNVIFANQVVVIP